MNPQVLGYSVIKIEIIHLTLATLTHSSFISLACRVPGQTIYQIHEDFTDICLIRVEKGLVSHFTGITQLLYSN